jgi:hypothetical protein
MNARSWDGQRFCWFLYLLLLTTTYSLANYIREGKEPRMSNAKKNIRQITIATIESFCKRKGISIREFGAVHMGDPFFVYRLKKATTDPRLSTIQKAWDAVS